MMGSWTEGATKLPRVGIVILTWNGWDDTVQCLRSISIEGARKFTATVYVVDNKSDEPAPEGLAREFPEARLIRNADNLGYAGGNNVGINTAMCEGCDFVLLLNNDTVVGEDFIGRLMQPLLEDPTVGMTVPKILFYEKPNRIQCAGGAVSCLTGHVWRRGYGELDVGQYEATESTQFCMGSAVLIRTSLLQTIGLLDEDFFMYQEDADFSLRALKVGAQITYVGAATIQHKESASTGGYMNAFSFYYSMRNRISLVMRHGNAIEKFVFIAYMAGFFWIGVVGYSVMKQRPDIARAFMLAVLSHFKGEKGRSLHAEALRKPPAFSPQTL